jgi:RND family efflux transporter MFP subunit
MTRRALILLSFILLVACKKEATPEAPVQTVRAGLVDRISPEAAERYSTTISPFDSIDMAFKSVGLIDHIYQVRSADGRTRDVEAGDKVTKGTELAVVRRVDYEQRVQQAQAQVAQAEAQLAQVSANLREAEIEYTRAKTLFESGSLVKPSYDQAKGSYESAQATVQGAQAAIANARTVVDQSKLSLSDTVLRATFSGWITARNVTAGSLVGESTVGFSMVDTHVVKAVFAVPDVGLKSVRLGQQQSVLLDAVQHPLRGVITSISPQADSKSRVFLIEVSIDNSKEEVRPGMIGTLVDGSAKEAAPRLVVPLSAVVHSPKRPEGFAVFRVSQSRRETVRRGAGYSDRQHLRQLDRGNRGRGRRRAHRHAWRFPAP